MNTVINGARAMRKAAAACAALGLAAAPARADNWLNDMFFPERAATFADSNDHVMFFVFWVSVFFFVLLMALMVFFAIRYRRRPGVPQQRSASHNLRLELTWSIVPLFLCVVMFWWGLEIYMRMHVAPAQAELINVTAKKWAWAFEYGPGNSSTEIMMMADKESPVYAVPLGRPVKLIMNSSDVIHSLFIPAFRKKIDVMPNRFTTYWFEATTPGDYPLFCAEYCGDQHSQMMAMIRVLPEAEYQAWIAKQNDTSGIPLPELGKLLHTTKGCNACHSIDGAPGTGPTWVGIWMKEHRFTDGTTGIADMNYMRESILNPGVKIVAGYPNQMPTYQGQLSDRELRALITYIMTLGGDQGQKDAEDMIKEDESLQAGETGGQASAVP